VLPGVHFATQTGNLYTGSLYLALCSLLHTVATEEPCRIGLFSYGSGCSSEFFSGVLRRGAADSVRELGLSEAIGTRQRLDLDEYERLSSEALNVGFGVRQLTVDQSIAPELYRSQFSGRGLLVVAEIEGYHRVYHWS
jgi:polyketide biosynthesis 3-hydroxy-3-methylglutaryl-CoA synthase-like enzyme PksG